MIRLFICMDIQPNIPVIRYFRWKIQNNCKNCSISSVAWSVNQVWSAISRLHRYNRSICQPRRCSSCCRVSGVCWHNQRSSPPLPPRPPGTNRAGRASELPLRQPVPQVDTPESRPNRRPNGGFNTLINSQPTHLVQRQEPSLINNKLDHRTHFIGHTYKANVKYRAKYPAATQLEVQ